MKPYELPCRLGPSAREKGKPPAGVAVIVKSGRSLAMGRVLSEDEATDVKYRRRDDPGTLPIEYRLIEHNPTIRGSFETSDVFWMTDEPPMTREEYDEILENNRRRAEEYERQRRERDEEE